MDTASYPAWDNRQIAHFLCRADRRVLSQPHSWLHAGVGALEVPAHVLPPVQIDALKPTNQLSGLDITWRNLGVSMIITMVSLHLKLINQIVQQAYYLATQFIAKIAVILADIIDKTR